MEISKYYYFFELNEILLDRYPSQISKEILNENKDAKFVFIYSEKYVNDGVPKTLPNNSICIYIPYLSLKIIDNLILKYPPINCSVFGMRMPDLVILTYFNKIGIKTLMIQHGIFISHLKRINLIKLFFKKFLKFFKYFIFSYRISNVLGVSPTRLLVSFYYYFISGSHKFKDLPVLNNNKILAKVALLFDSGWDEYYISTYNYSKKNFKYIGNPDDLWLQKIISKEKENAICYISQSLVEDGRYNRKDYIDFLNAMIKNLKDFKLYFKLHPRTKKTLIENIKPNNIIFTENIPNCKFYIGHYSSLLKTLSNLDSKILIWDLDNHKTPEDYYKYSDYNTNDWDELIKQIDMKSNFKKNLSLAMNIISKNNNPIKNMAYQIVKSV